MLCKYHFSKKGQVFFYILWVVTLIMQSRVDVKVDDNDIKAGSYQATWTPGSGKDDGYGVIYINGDQNTSIQVEPNKAVDLSFKDGDTITFQFAGNGDNDKLTLDQK